MAIIKEHKKPQKRKIISKIYLIRTKKELRGYDKICKIKLFTNDENDLCYDCGALSGEFLTSSELRLIADYLDKRNNHLVHKHNGG